MHVRSSAVALACLLQCQCGPTPVPCTGPSQCESGNECLAHRCVPLGSEPVAQDSQRLVAEVTELAVITSEGDFGGALPGFVALGAERTGTLELLLKFEPTWRAGGRIEQAFLLLDPLPQARSAAAQVAVDVWRIEHAWSRADVTWMSQPALGYPKANGIASSNGAPLRIEVTQLVNYLREHPEHDYGVALRAAAVHDTGVPYATGVAGGSAPRIEVYGR
ncbi:MAG TPA: DNRLRE domain-containing protein [Polyangiaceae bacterium]